MKRSLCISFFLILFLIHNRIQAMMDFKKEALKFQSQLETMVIQSPTEQQFFEQANKLFTQVLKDTSPSTINNRIFFESQECPVLFTQLLPEINGKIFDICLFADCNDSDLKNIAVNLHRLYCVGKSMSNFIDVQKNTLNLIKKLSLLSKKSNEHVASLLPTAGTRKCIFIQRLFDTMCKDKKITEMPEKDFLTLQDFGYDIDFTYGDKEETQLLKTCLPDRQINSLLMKSLLAHGADYTMQSRSKGALIFDLLENIDEKADEALAHLFKHPQFNINYCYKSRVEMNVPALWFFVCSILQENPSRPFYVLKLNRLQKLLDHGADPELCGSTGIKPLVMAQMAEDKNIIAILEKAIAKKKAGETQNTEKITKHASQKNVHKKRSRKNKKTPSKKNSSREKSVMTSIE